MNAGLYLSARGALTSVQRMDVLSNNLANLSTVGFKADELMVKQQPAPARHGFDLPPHPIDALAAGHRPVATQARLSQGALTATGRPLDVALEGRGFLVTSVDPQDPGAARLTRDGRLTLDEHGHLITAGDGAFVLDDRLQPLRLDRSSVATIDQDGTIRQADRAVGRLRLVDADAAQLEKESGQRFQLRGGQVGGLNAAAPTVHAGFVEASAVDPIRTLNELMTVTRTVQANLSLMQYHDQLLGRTFNTFGRVV